VLRIDPAKLEIEGETANEHRHSNRPIG